MRNLNRKVREHKSIRYRLVCWGERAQRRSDKYRNRVVFMIHQSNYSNEWEYHEFEKELANANTEKLLEMFKRENDNFTTKCTELATYLNNCTEEVSSKIEKVELECDLLDDIRIKIALRIAEILIDIEQ